MKHIFFTFIIIFYIGCGTTNDSKKTQTNIILSNNSIDENSIIGTIIADIEIFTDITNSQKILTLVNNYADNNLVLISNNQLLINSKINYENKSNLDIKINLNNGVEDFTKVFNIKVNDINELASDILITNNIVDENISLDSVVGILQSIDEDNNTNIFTILNDNYKFKIEGNILKTNSNYDYNITNKYDLEINVNDGANDFTKIISIFIRNINQTNKNKSMLDILNNIRTSSGMLSLSSNKELDNSSYNHALYLDSNSLSGHNEDNNNLNFTGISTVNRALYVGYKSKKVSENLSVGQKNIALSIEGLMGAIYHRFGFLDFKINTIGYGIKNKTYVYNMGNSDLNTICNDESYAGHNAYYMNVCSEESLKIDSTKYNNELNKTINTNPSYVIYPYLNEQNVTTVFYEEHPDPLPSYGISGYPISIEFNPNKYNMSELSINSFMLYDESNNIIELVQDFKDSSTILSKLNDNNNHLDEYKFVIFPKNRLNFNKVYKVEFSYNYQNIGETITWNFKTKDIHNLITYDGIDIEIQKDKLYNLYIPAQNNTDSFNKSNISCSYSSSVKPITDVNFYDGNIITIKVQSQSAVSCVLTLNANESNERIINIDIP